MALAPLSADALIRGNERADARADEGIRALLVAASPRCVFAVFFALATKLLRLADSAFGLRISFGLRVSHFGFLLLLLSPGVADAQTTNAPAPVSLEDISKAMAKADTVFTRFVQERHLSLFNEPLKSEGWLCFQKPGRIRWEITSPYQSILVSDGSGVAQLERVDEKWKKLDIGLADALQNVVSQIGGVMEGRYASNKRDYEVSVTNSATGPVITLVPRHEAMRRMMKAIEVHLAPDLKATRRVVLRETGGDDTDIRFSEQVVGVELPAKTFDRSAPLELEQVRAAVAKAQTKP